MTLRTVDVAGLLERDEYEPLEYIGGIRLPKRGRVLVVRMMPDPEHGPGVDLREYITEERWAEAHAARARAVASGRKLGPRPPSYVGWTRRGWRLGPLAADTLAELLMVGVVRAEDSDVSPQIRPKDGCPGSRLRR